MIEGDYPGPEDKQVHQSKFNIPKFATNIISKFLIKLITKIDTLLCEKIIKKSKPNFIVYYDDDEKKIYLERWHIIQRNKIFNMYLHQFTEPDPDYNLHDHPWFSISLVLFNGYQEQTIKYGGIFHYKECKIGSLSFISPWHTHRICMIYNGMCRTLFITGPKIRKWGFHDSFLGWVKHETYKRNKMK